MKEQLRSYWLSLGQREQYGVIATGVLLVIYLFYMGLINPLLTRAANAEQALANEKQLAAWVENKVSQIQALKRAGAVGTQGSLSNMPVNQAVTSSVARFGLKIVRLQPQGANLQVWLQPLPFNSLLQWLDELEKRYGIMVKSIAVNKTAATGMVEIKQLELGRM